MHGMIIICAFVLDLILGDPRRFPHPVRGIGRFIQITETILRRFSRTPKAEKIAGIFLVILVVPSVYIFSRLLISSASSITPGLGFALSTFMAYTTLAARGLGDAAKSVLARLDEGDIARARRELSMIVGRDTANLDEKEIVRAVIETVAENASDGVVAPLFYMAVGGPALAMAYKAVNTLDSMVGYKNEKYIYFGWAAARLDDAANFIPARITAIMICLAADISRRLKPRIRYGAGSAATPHALRLTPDGNHDSAFRTPDRGSPIKAFEDKIRGQAPHSEFYSPWRIVIRDHANHPSPNSGYPEAAMAGALGVRLGGTSTYFGKISQKPYIGDAHKSLDKKYIEKSVRLMYCAGLSAALAAAFLASALNFS